MPARPLPTTDYDMLRPATSIAQTFSRDFISSFALPTASTVPSYSAIPLYSGQTVSNLSVLMGSTAMATPTHWWAGLFDIYGDLLAVTADQLAVIPTVSAFVTLPLVTPYTPQDTEMGYVGICFTAGTPPTLGGILATVNLPQIPFLAGLGTAQSLPPVPGVYSVPPTVNNKRFHAFTS